jgi:succinate-acetate transporter protein
MSTSVGDKQHEFDPPVAPAAPAASSADGIADPGPLGLAAFAATTFVLVFRSYAAAAAQARA